MKTKLLIVPATYGVAQMNVFEGLKVVVLDDMLFSGFAGTYFRRLIVQSILNPALRGEYENKRVRYLQVVLREKNFPDGTVFVGTRAADVDLLDFGAVYVADLNDRALRAMGRKVYGDPVMLCMDYQGVVAAVEQAADEKLAVVDWTEIPLLVMRHFPDRPDIDVTMHVAKQRNILTEILADQDDAQVWLEEPVYRSGIEKRTFFLADYDYLSFIMPAWRDAIVRMLGKAPSIVEVFRMPWFVVDSTALSSLCYRMDISGRPTATARGSSLISFVQAKLAGNVSAREMIGTWIGGLLCDDVTAVDTISSLGVRPIASSGHVDQVQRACVGTVRVPREYAWMYAAVSGTTVCEWTGERKLDGTPYVKSDDLLQGWISSLVVSDMFASYENDPVMAVHVVQFLSRLHAIFMPFEYMTRVFAHIRDVLTVGCTRQVFDVWLTPMVPGYNYLSCFAPDVRFAAVRELGFCPALSALVGYVDNLKSSQHYVSMDEIYADYSRVMIYACKPLPTIHRVGFAEFRDGEPAVHTDSRRPGYCYECLFRPEFHEIARVTFGPYPTLQNLLSTQYDKWRIDGSYDLVRVSYGKYVGALGLSSTVLHMDLGQLGVSLREYLLVDKGTRVRVKRLKKLRVGQTGVCYSSTWYVAAIISWTIVGCCLFGFAALVLYKRCAGSRGGPRRMY